MENDKRTNVLFGHQLCVSHVAEWYDDTSCISAGRPIVQMLSKVKFMQQFFVLQPFYSVLLAYFVKLKVIGRVFYYSSNVIFITFESADGRLKLREQYAPLYERLSFTCLTLLCRRRRRSSSLPSRRDPNVPVTSLPGPPVPPRQQQSTQPISTRKEQLFCDFLKRRTQIQLFIIPFNKDN